MKKFKLHSPHLTCGWPKPWTSRDYWVTHTLGEALTDAGGRAVYGDADIDVYLWGVVNEPVNLAHTNALWIIGNPSGLLDLLRKNQQLVKSAFRYYFCASTQLLPAVWDSARIVPYTAHQDMQQHGLVPDSCLDTMVNSSALVLPAKNPGFSELGIDTPQWETVDELESLVGYYLKDESQRKQIVDAQNKAASQFNYAYVARQILSCIN